jgi:ketosteroid isomerase-like protein
MRSAVLVLLLLAAPAAAAPPERTPPYKIASEARTPLQSMVAAERSFAKRAADTSVREAFLAWLAPDAVMLNPLPVNGRSVYLARPVNTAKLVWEPEYAEVAASGDYGVSSGPWEFTPPGDTSGAKRVNGTFLSIWKRDGRNGAWRVALDCGVPHAKPAEAIAFEAGPEHAIADAATKPVTVDVLQRADAALAADSPAPRASDDVRYLRAGEPPLRGDAAREALAAAPHGTTWRPLGGSVARTGDLGCTYGVRVTAGGAHADTVVYVHVWRRVAPTTWKLSAIVDNPLQR